MSGATGGLPASVFRDDGRSIWIGLALVHVAIALVTPQAATAQIDLLDDPPAAGADPDTVGNGVYLNDSFEATDAMARLQPLVRDGRWRDAATLLQGISNEYGDKLIRRDLGYYVSLRRHVTETIAGWPKAGLDAYRELYERGVGDALEKRKPSKRTDLARELPIVERFFCTAAAFELAEKIALRAIEAGDLSLAEHVYVRLLDDHPDAPAHADHLRSMLAIVRALERAIASPSDRPDRGQETPIAMSIPSSQNKRPSEHPPDLDARVRWKGTDRPLRDVLEEIRRGFSSLHASATDSEWPLFGGNAERNRIAGCTVDELGVQWRFGFERSGSDTNELGPLDAEDAPEIHANALTVHPQVSGDLVVIQRNRDITALRRATGDVIWHFGADTERARQGEYIQPRDAGWNAVTIADGRVYAALPGEGKSYYGYASSQMPDELICLDARTGQVLWRTLGRHPGTQPGESQYDSSPIVEHGRVHIVGRRRRSFGFEDCYLFQFDARTGDLLTRTHLGSASTGTFGLQPATKAIAALHGDSVYVCSNLGSIASVSAYTGQVQWIRLYRRLARGEGGRHSSDVMPWHYNAVVWSPKGLIAVPMDANDILILAPQDGRVMQEIPLSQVGGSATLLGVHDESLCAAGDKVACFDINSGRPLWTSESAENLRPAGRAVWANNGLLVPVQSGIRVFDVKSGAHSEMPWDPEGEYGNIVALPDQLLVAGSRYLTAYVRKSEIWKALKTRLEAAPNDPMPALELAEVAMRSGEVEESLTALDVAVARALSGPLPAGDDVRRRLFADALGFARTLADRGELAAHVVDRLFRVASQFPTDADEHLKYRLRFAALYRAQVRADLSLKLYQQVLADRSLRDLKVEPGENRGLSAASFVMARVDELIKTFGAELYEPYESEAERLLAAARQNSDESVLGRIVEAYPNSAAAPLALVERGTMLARRGRSTEALRYLIQAYHRYSQRVNKPDLLKRIADTLEWAGRREDAYRWLTKAALEYPSALIEDDDKRVTFRQYRHRFDDVRNAVEPHLPHVAPPVESNIRLTLAEPMALLEPRFRDEPGMRWSLAFVYADGSIRAMNPRDGSETWPEPLAVREPVDLLIARHDVVIFATSFEVMGVNPQTGKRLWTHGQYPKMLDRPDADWEDANAIRSLTLRSNMLAVLYEDARVTAIDLPEGTKLWSDVLAPAPTADLTLGDRLLAYPATKDDRTVIGLADSLTGAWIDLIETDERLPVSDLVQTLDGQIILVTSQTISAYDVDQRALRWRISIGGHLGHGSFLLDLDAVYFSPDGRDLRKVSLEDGRVLWDAIGLLGRDEHSLKLDRTGAQLIVSTEESIVGVDAVSGMTLWRGTAPTKRKFEHRLITRDFVVALNQGDETEDAQVFFYDLRNASGVIPENGAPRISRVDDLRRIVALDGAIYFQTGPTSIVGLSSK